MNAHVTAAAMTALKEKPRPKEKYRAPEYDAYDQWDRLLHRLTKGALLAVAVLLLGLLIRVLFF